MGDGRSDSGRDWSFRRKLSSSNATGKSSSTKESSRSKGGKGASTTDASSSGPPAPSRTPSSGNRSIPTSPNGRTPSTSKPKSSLDDHDSTPTTPIFGNVPGGFRTNLFRSGRERAAPIQEESPTEAKAKPGSGGSSPRDAKFTGGRGKGPGEFANLGLARTTSASMSDVHSLVPSEDIPTGGEVEGDEENRRDGKRGSVIEKVTQKAKLVLPLKRTKELGKSESTRSLAGKSTGSSSSMHSSPKISGGHRGQSSEDEDDRDEEEQRSPSMRGPTRPSTGEKRSRHLPSASVDEDKLSPTSTGRKESTSSPEGDASPQNIIRSKTVPPRITHSDMLHRDLGTPISGKPHSNSLSSSNSARMGGNRIMDMPSPEPRVQDSPEPEAAAQRSLPLRSPKSINSLNAARQKKPSMNSIREVSLSAAHASGDPAGISSPRVSNQTPHAVNRPSALRSTSAIKMSSSAVATTSTTASANSRSSPLISGGSGGGSRQSRRAEKRAPTFAPPMPDPASGTKVDPAPPTGIYWSRASCFGYDHAALRAHTTTLIGSNIYVFGGCDSKACFNDLYVFDADCLFWSTPECTGDVPPPLRAMTATAVGKKIVIFGGGDGGTYTNDIYVLDTLNFRYTKVTVEGPQPCKRRAHTACLYRSGIFVFGGGDGERALNDVWRLDVSDMTKLSWKLISPASVKVHASRPTARGYHTANMVGAKMIVFGGSDGVECFRDVWVFDVDSLGWKSVDVKLSFPRLSHTATVVGSYLFVIGGHDGVEYSADVLLLNLVTMQWDRRKTYGGQPSGRGYHGTVLHDSRLFVVGGFDGHTVFDDTFVLELAVCAYYSQISHFTIDV